MPLSSVVRALLVAVIATLVTVPVAGSASAAAGDCIRQEIKIVDGKPTYVCVEYEGGGTIPGGNGSGGNAPTCDLTGSLYNDFCKGDDACFINDPAAIQDTEENGLSEESKPNPDSHAVYWECQRADGSTYELYYWNDDQPTITIEDRLRAALGAIDIPDIEASFNPPTRTLVNLPTWWWAEGAPPGEIRGTEALAMVGFAVPRGMSIVPGDGSPSFSCPLSVTKSDTCTYEYRRAGDYTATVSIVYDLRFEIGGEPLPLGDIPPQFRTYTVDDDVPVTVREVQTRVTKVR